MPIPEMVDVFSSHVEAIGHDGETLYVRWDSGKVSAYAGVPVSLADDVAKAWSVGEALARDVKGKYPHRYVG